MNQNDKNRTIVDLIFVMVGLILGAIVSVLSTVLHAVVMLILTPFAFLRGYKTSTEVTPDTEKVNTKQNRSGSELTGSIRALEERTMPTAEDFKREIHRIMSEGQSAEKEFVEINAGELHRRVAGYPGKNHRMPNCCQVMRAQMLDSADMVVDAPPSGLGAALTIRYCLPRRDWG